MSGILIIVVFIVLFALSGMFSGAEIALFSLSRAAVKKIERQKNARSRAVVKLKASPHRLLVTILIGNNIVNIYAAALATDITIGLVGSKGVGVATGIVTFLILLFGEIFPKALAQAYADRIALWAARPLLVLLYVLWPLVVVLEFLSKAIVKMMPGEHQATMGIEDEISTLLRIGLEEGSTEAYERDFIERLFKFNDTKVRKIMIPYKEAVMVDGEAEISQIAHFLATSDYSRFPVYQGSKQNVVGMVHVKDVFRANNSDRRDDAIGTLARQAVVVDIDDKLDEVFGLLRMRRAHSALAQDKEGVIAGFVTMEDVLERLVGDIQDEFDPGVGVVVDK